MRFVRLIVGAFLVGSAGLQACLWDRDTMTTERTRFPEVAQIVGGVFPRHSVAYHEWRRAQCEKAIASGDRTPGVYDDLAVSQHKLGDHKAAIETMMAKEAALPGLYETYSNLGTFYIYLGDLDEAERHIRRALEINADAHFGREKYQLWLVEWIKSWKTAGREEITGPGEAQYWGFAAFIAKKTGASASRERWDAERVKAIKGILGMMRFADYDNPLLLEALGDVLVGGGFKGSPSSLAAECYLQASKHSTKGGEKERFMRLMDRAGKTSDRYSPKDVYLTLEASMSEARVLNEQVARDEAEWIREGKDATAEFARKYLPPAAKEASTGKR